MDPKHSIKMGLYCNLYTDRIYKYWFDFQCRMKNTHMSVVFPQMFQFSLNLSSLLKDWNSYFKFALGTSK